MIPSLPGSSWLISADPMNPPALLPLDDAQARHAAESIGRLRRAIKSAGGGNPLRTVRSLGYVFDLN